MKKLIPFLAIIPLLFSCSKEVNSDFLIGRWVYITNAKESALVLVFDGYNLEVINGSREYKPFVGDYVWEYYLDEDSVLNLSRYVGTDVDGDNDYEYLNLDLSMSDNNTLHLTQHPAFHSDRHLSFMRRK